MDIYMEHIEYGLNVGKAIKTRLYEVRNAKSISLELSTDIKSRAILLNADLRAKVSSTLEEYYMTKLEEIRTELEKWVKKAALEFIYLSDDQQRIYNYVMEL